MASSEDFQFSEGEDGNVLMKKYLALRNKCEQIQQGNEKLVNRLQHVKKMIKYYTRQKKFLEKRLDAYNDNYKDAQVPVMWEEDQMYNLLKPPQGISGGLPGAVRESPSTSSSRPKSAKKIKSMLKTTPGGKSPSSHLSASQLQESMMSPSSSQRNERLLIVQESPKRPANAFMMFCDQYKQSIQNEYMKEHKAVIPQQELAKRLTLKWNSLEPEDKKIYFDMFEIERRSAEEEASTAYITQNALDSMYIESDNAVSSLLAGHDAL